MRVLQIITEARDYVPDSALDVPISPDIMPQSSPHILRAHKIQQIVARAVSFDRTRRYDLREVSASLSGGSYKISYVTDVNLTTDNSYWDYVNWDFYEYLERENERYDNEDVGGIIMPEGKLWDTYERLLMDTFHQHVLPRLLANENRRLGQVVAHRLLELWVEPQDDGPDEIHSTVSVTVKDLD